jgi:hypothetical protein
MTPPISSAQYPIKLIMACEPQTLSLLSFEM